MTDNEFLFEDRITKIQSVIEKYGEDNFYLSFSGGKDSTVLHYLLDMAIPKNQIPRVYANTGIELNMIRDFVVELAEKDKRIVIIKSSVPIKPMLEREGYPFKSKYHSKAVYDYKRSNGKLANGRRYYKGENIWNSRVCPQKLKYQFEQEMPFKISDKCCEKIKEEPLHNWQKENNKPYGIVGLMRDEGGRRESAVCLAFSDKSKKKLKNFQPLVAVNKSWEDWFINTYNLKICDIYKPPYNFDRTGCKGCPFALHLQKDLDTLEKFFPNERKQCELIWRPVYEEYRRLGYRLRKKDEGLQLTFEDMEVMN